MKRLCFAHERFTRPLAGCFAGLCVLLLGLATETNSYGQQFTPEMEEFVRNFIPGGQDWTGKEPLLSPEESLQTFMLAEGLEVEVVASEPLIRQPIQMHFDERGRLWVVQYLQYPFPAGVTVVDYDMYLRATFDKVPLPPPHHDRGSDKITILEDTTGDGQFDSAKDFVTGLNITTAVAVGRGGVWVLTPPYLLFYPDRDRDDVPDADPDVHLAGFGLEDTHAVANSLHWGPDGWLYGAQGSTCTASIDGIEFLGQAIWRYHPESREFEIFAEGGGNTWSMEFDSKGRAFSGTNHGANRAMHYVQGGYYIKGWTKHGPLTNPFAFGFLNHMDHTGYTPRFASTLAIYAGGALPQYDGQIIGGMSMVNRIQATRLLPKGSTFKTIDSEDTYVAKSGDRAFRPVDVKVGPDGAIYIADWYDLRISHLNPADTWNKDGGRIYRIKAKGAEPIPPFDLGALPSEQLIPLLSHENKWFRDQARRLLADRRDERLARKLRRVVGDDDGQLALEALWAVNAVGGLDEAFALRQLRHSNPYVRLWTVRLVGDSRQLSREMSAAWVALAGEEDHVEVRSQLAASCKRLPAQAAFPVIRELLVRDLDVEDTKIPLQLWWAIENKAGSDREQIIRLLEDPKVWESLLFRRHILPRLGRRYAADRGSEKFYTLHQGAYSEWQMREEWAFWKRNLETCAELLAMAPTENEVKQLVRGIEQGLRGGPVRSVPESLSRQAAAIWAEFDHTPVIVRFGARLGIEEALLRALETVVSQQANHSEREEFMALLAERREPRLAPFLLDLLVKEQGGILAAIFRALAQYEDPAVANGIINAYPNLSPRWRATAQEVLSSKVVWARLLMESVDQAEFPPEQLTDATVAAIRQHGDPDCNTLLEQHMQRLLSGSNQQDLQLTLERGREVYQFACASCHLAGGEGLMGLAPSLHASRWISAPEPSAAGILVRIVLNGKRDSGGLRMQMPSFSLLEDDQIAAVLTYIRREWGYQDEFAVSRSLVTKVREGVGERDEAWTERELLELLNAR